METVPVDLMSPFGNRDQALDLTRTTTGLPLPAAHSLVLTLDAVSTAVLHAAGVPITDALPILGALWRMPERISDRPGHTRRPSVPADDYLRDLGERVHVVRRARRFTLTGVHRRTGISVPALRDLEAGAASPTVLMLLRLADVFQVPVAMLVDEKATPLRILRLLASTHAA